MIKIIKLLLTLLFIPILTEAQKFGYVNSEFILKNMKEYSEAMNDIDLLSKAWEKEISDMYIEMEKKEINLKNEEILLTKDMYNERRKLLDKEWVSIREYQQKVFGFEGLYFLKKKELIEPIQ
ncbi:MAG TPA: OmpH family outer membrane protein, partial [Cytophagales bacterium]|nr:OmpH family outer membrane protein [Cytophagales bacterium]